MKHLFATLFLWSVLSSVSAQKATYDTTAPYRKNPNIPSFQVLQPDSTWFKSSQIPHNKTLVIMYFNPDCGHCQQEAKNIATHMDQLKNAFFVLVSYHSPQEIGTFLKEYKLDNFSNIRCGRDTQYYIPSYFRIKFTPFIAVYNKQGKLEKTFETGAEPDELVKLVQ